MRAVELGLRSRDPLRRPLEGLARAIYCGLGAVEEVRRVAKRARAVVKRGLLRAQRRLRRVLHPLALVRRALARFGDSVTRVGDSVTRVRNLITPIGGVVAVDAGKRWLAGLVVQDGAHLDRPLAERAGMRPQPARCLAQLRRVRRRADYLVFVSGQLQTTIAPLARCRARNRVTRRAHRAGAA